MPEQYSSPSPCSTGAGSTWSKSTHEMRAGRRSKLRLCMLCVSPEVAMMINASSSGTCYSVPVLGASCR